MKKLTVYNNLHIAFAISLILCCFSCKKYLTIDPPINQLSPDLVFDNADAATSAMLGIYIQMRNGGGSFASGDYLSLPTLTGFSSDEFTALGSNTHYLELEKNEVLVTNGPVAGNVWDAPYKFIYSANAILEGLSKSTIIPDVQKGTLEGEAKFVRAFCYFYLTNLYGDVPLHLATDYRPNNSATRSPQSAVYSQIIQDLKDAYDLLKTEYPTVEKVRPNKSVVSAFLARVYLYQQMWTEAESLSTQLIENTSMFSLSDDLNDVFLKNSTEAIWQLMPSFAFNRNTNEAETFLPMPTLFNLSVTENLYHSFEPGDRRQTEWLQSIEQSGVTLYYPFKYKVFVTETPQEYSMVMRLAEQYLIRAEARIHLNNIEGGIEDLNMLRTRARSLPTVDVPDPLPDLAGSLNTDDALLAVEKERRAEFFSEWGHRWMDLKRTNRATAVIGAFKGATWQATDVLYPIPAAEINGNPKITQNEGY